MISSLSTTSSSTTGGTILKVYGTDFGESPKIKIVLRALDDIVYNDTNTSTSNEGGINGEESAAPASLNSRNNRRRSLLEEASAHDRRPQTRIIITSVEECQLVEEESSHNSVSCVIPPGQGNLHLIQVDAAGQISNGSAFGYAAPSLTSITPDFGDTKGKFEIILNGTNFGLKASLTVGNRSALILKQNHTHIIALAPGGKGLYNDVQVHVQDQSSNSLNLQYLPPSISLVYPNPADAHNGELITIEGRNFGSSTSNVSVEIGGVECNNAQWVNLGLECNITDSDGEPACNPVIQCMTPPLQKIGSVDIILRVAEQEVLTGKDHIFSLSCPFNMYGATGEDCRPCPVGALCPGQGRDPISLSGWWSIDVDTFVKCIPAKACIGEFFFILLFFNSFFLSSSPSFLVTL